MALRNYFSSDLQGEFQPMLAALILGIDSEFYKKAD